MALIKCPECGKEVSSEANACIHCGFPLKKENKENNEINGQYVIGYRGGPGGLLALYIVSFVFGLLLIIGAIVLSCIFSYSPVIVMSVFEGIIGAVLFTISLIKFIGIGINASNKNPCIAYDGNIRKIILYPTMGKEIVINPEDYLELRDNFFTDNILKFTYRLPDGTAKKVSLGYCANRNELRNRINKIMK